MVKRGLSAIVGIGIFLALCFGGLLPFAVGATVIAALATCEWVTAYQRADKVEAKAGDRPRMKSWLTIVNVGLAWAGVALPIVLYFGLTSPVRPWRPILQWLGGNIDYSHIYIAPTMIRVLVVPVFVFSLLVLRAVLSGKTLGKFRVVYGGVALVYIGLLISSFVLLRALTGPCFSFGYHELIEMNPYAYQIIYVKPFGGATWGAWLMLFVAVCVWMTDTGAYLVGRKWGRHKLAPSLSPNKTIEGSLGGLALALLTGALFGLWIHLPLRDGLMVGLIAGVMGQVGDLFESALKREIGIKDFGGIMPGHGGALDRFDSLLFVTPLAFCYLHFIAKL